MLLKRSSLPKGEFFVVVVVFFSPSNALLLMVREELGDIQKGVFFHG